MEQKQKKFITKTVYASQIGAWLDSNVITGGGSDDTEIIQQALNIVGIVLLKGNSA